MMSDTAFNAAAEAEIQPKRRSRLRAAFSKDRKAQFGLVVLVLFILGAILAPVLAPYDPNEMTLNMMNGPSSEHLLGTDDLGRDLFSRILWGTQISLFVGVATVALALLFGVLSVCWALLRWLDRHDHHAIYRLAMCVQISSSRLSGGRVRHWAS